MEDCYEHGNEPLGSMLGSPRVAAELADSEEGLSSMSEW
jgi:hypothetical protein